MNPESRTYLLNSDPAAQELLHKLEQLIESEAMDNIRLAFQLLEGGGVPEEVNTYLAAIYLAHSEKTLRDKAKHLLNLYADPTLISFLENTKRSNQFDFNEQNISNFLEGICQRSDLDCRTLGWLFLKFTKRGVRFCLKHKVRPARQILDEIIEQDALHLANFKLETLPDEVGEFTNLKVLDITGNHFFDIPESLANLKQLEQLYFFQTPLSNRSIRFLEQNFSHIFAKRYYQNAQEAYQEARYKAAIHLSRRSIELMPQDYASWYLIAILHKQQAQKEKMKHALRQAQALLRQELTADPDNAEKWLYQAAVLAHQNNSKAALKSLKQAFNLNSDCKKIAQEEEELQALRQLPNFEKIIA